RPDAILSHSALPNIYARIVCGRIPVITVLHSSSRDFEMWTIRVAESILRCRTRGVIAVNEARQREYVAQFRTSNVILVPNGISDDLPQKREYPASPR